MQNKMTIGAVANRSGLRASAVRFYERQGLVASERLANGYRAYDQQAVNVLRFIGRAKGLGFSLEEVRDILAVRRKGEEPCACVTKMIERNIASIDQRIAELSRLRRQLRALIKSPAQARRTEAICTIIESEGLPGRH